MALNGSTSVAVTAYDSLKFTWVQNGQSTVNNLTTINWSLQLIAGSAGQIISSAQKAWSVTINGTTYSGVNSVAVGNNTTKTLASGQVSITHDADGSKSFKYSFSQEFSITFAGVNVGTITGSGTGVLNTIPRATQPSLNVSSIDMGGTVTIYTPRASASFTHDLAYSFAGSDYVTFQTGVTTSMYWAVPISLAERIPNTTNGTVTIRCTTKNGSATVGVKTVLLTAKVPATATPTISTVALTEAVSKVSSTVGAYVQSKSALKATITAGGVYGSTVKSYSTVFEGKTYTGASFTTDTVSGSGTINLVTTVTDSRGRSASKTTSISVLGYEAPQITTFTVARYDASGEADPDGTNAWVRVAYGVTSLNSKNTATAKIQYKRSADSTWSTLYTRTETSLDGTLKPTGVTFSTDYQWDFRVTLTDAFNSATPATYNTVLPSGAVILDIKADGKGIAFFKTSTRDGVEIAGELPGSSIPLTTGQNLNNLTTPGFYAIPTATISATILNKPFTDNATACIEVKRTGDGAVKQIVQKASKTDGVIFERDRDASGWGAWHIVYSGAGRILWTGSSLLTSGQTITFSEPMSQQQSGVVLIFSRYTTTAQDYYYSCHFIPKLLVTAATAAGQTAAGVAVTMATSEFDYIAGKFLRITDTGVTGDTTNNASGTKNGITYNNGGFALRYVVGV